MPKILIIDDSKVSLLKHKELLLQIGFEVICAKGGQEGIETFEKERPDIVISDITMPDLDGFEVLEEIQAINPKIPIYFISAEKSKSLEQKALSIGAKGYLQKPVKLEILKSTLAEFIEIR